MSSSLRVKNENFKKNDCAIVEGMISSAGKHKLLRFTATFPNHGPGDLIIGAPSDHPELFEFSPCHGHYHFKHYADYRLWTVDGYNEWKALRDSMPADVLSQDLLDANPDLAAKMVRGAKRAFCNIDVRKFDPAAGPAKYLDCFTNQGISVGWADEYGSQLDGQWIDITKVPNGNYMLEVEANASHILTEGNYANNSTAVPGKLPL